MIERSSTLASRPGLKVKRQNLAQQAAVRLREAIIAGDFPPDMRLTEVDLAGQLAVSRGTLRTALAQLDTEGFVVCERYSAWRVASLGRHEIWESYTFRAALESMAARLTAERIDSEIRRDLGQLLERLVSATRPAVRAERDLALHLAIVRHAGHNQLLAIYQRTLDRFRWIYALSEAHAPARIDLFDWHRPLVEAISAGDSKRAAEIAHEMIMASLADDLDSIAGTEARERSA